MTEDQIKHMVERFLGWKLPRDSFNPDCGISFDKGMFNAHTPHPMRYEPSGTNLFDAVQAEAMVRYMLEGMPPDDGAVIRAATAPSLSDIAWALVLLNDHGVAPAIQEMLTLGNPQLGVKPKALNAIVAALRSSPAPSTAARLKEHIDTRLNNILCEMKPNYDDSIVGFNEAWDAVRAILKEEIERSSKSPVNRGFVDIVFDGPPGPEAGRFVEVEDSSRKSIGWFGEWIHRDDGYWVLRVPAQAAATEDNPAALSREARRILNES